MPNWYVDDEYSYEDESPFSSRREKPAPVAPVVKKVRGGIKVGGGVFAAPTCPACNAHMMKRTNRRGEDFWGCSTWPACDGRPNIGDEDEMEWEAWSELVDW